MALMVVVLPNRVAPEVLAEGVDMEPTLVVLVLLDKDSLGVPLRALARLNSLVVEAVGLVLLVEMLLAPVQWGAREALGQLG